MDGIILSHCTINSDTPNLLSTAVWLSDLVLCWRSWLPSARTACLDHISAWSPHYRGDQEPSELAGKSLFQKLLWEEERSLWSQNVSRLQPEQAPRKASQRASEVIGFRLRAESWRFQNHTMMSFILKRHKTLSFSYFRNTRIPCRNNLIKTDNQKKTIVVFLKFLM